MLAIWSLVPLPFLNPAWTSGSSQFTQGWSIAWRNLSITLLACEMNAICVVVWTFFGIALLWAWSDLSFDLFLWPLLSGLPFPTPGDLPHLGSNPHLLCWQADSLPLSHPGSPNYHVAGYKILHWRSLSFRIVEALLHFLLISSVIVKKLDAFPIPLILPGLPSLHPRNFQNVLWIYRILKYLNAVGPTHSLCWAFCKHFWFRNKCSSLLRNLLMLFFQVCLFIFLRYFSFSVFLFPVLKCLFWHF